MADLTTLLGYLPRIVDIVLKIILLAIAIFFGRIAISGWKAKLNVITRSIGTIFLGGVCFVVGLLLPFDFLPQVKVISEMINAIIIAIFLYITLSFLSAKKSTSFSIPSRLKHDGSFLVGTILTVGFLVFVFTLMTPQNIAKLDETFSFYGFQLEQKECIGPVELLQKWNSNESKVAAYSYDLPSIKNSIDDYTKSNFDLLTDVCSQQIVVESNGTYGLVFLTNGKITTILNSCPVYKLLLIQRLHSVCSVNLINNDVCDCQGLSYPRLTVQLTTMLNNI
jgi:hypothetical protein